MNYMKQVAEILGVELGERFKIEEADGRVDYYLAEDGVRDDSKTGSGKTHPEVLENLLIGGMKLVKKPWKPQEDEKYWCVDPSGCIVDKYFSMVCNTDVLNYHIGNCFKSEGEARVRKEEIVKLFDEIINKYNND